MKALIEVVNFNVTDIVVTSPPSCENQFGGEEEI